MTTPAELVRWLRTCKPKLFAAIKVALIVFLSQFLLDVVGFVGDVREWADGADGRPFPSLSPLGKAAVSALSAALSGLALYVYNTIRPTSAPEYRGLPKETRTRLLANRNDRTMFGRRDRGALDAALILLVAVLIVAVLIYVEVKK